MDILQKVRKGARPKITSKEMERELSRFISRYPVFIFLLIKRPCIFVKHDFFRCWHKDASKRPAIKEIIEYFVSKLNGLNYDQQMMMPSSSEETSPTHTIISEPVRLKKAHDLKQNNEHHPRNLSIFCSEKRGPQWVKIFP